MFKKGVQEEMGSSLVCLISLSLFVLKTEWIFALVLYIFDESRP